MEKKFKLGPLKKREKKEKASGEKPSIKLARFIIEKQNWIVSVFVAACLLSAVAMLFVEVNYDLTEYLPDNAQSGIGLNKMEDEFGYPGTCFFVHHKSNVSVTDVFMRLCKLFCRIS